MQEESDIKIYRAPTISLVNQDFSINIDRNLLAYSTVANFYQTIKANINSKDLNFFYNNISGLKYDTKIYFFRNILLRIFGGNILYGTYDTEKNEIVIVDNRLIGQSNNTNTDSHELLHMSSTIYDANANIEFCGFSQINNNVVIGNALNEGYTELLNNRYFGPIPKDDSCYEYEKLIASLVEDIIGRDKMTSLYFNADLYNLVQELKKYTTESDIINFICILDILSKFGYYKHHLLSVWEYLISYFNEVNKFLIETYTKKLRIEYENKEITQKEFYLKLNKYTRKMKKLPKVYYFMSKINLHKNIKSILAETGTSKILQRKRKK